MKSTYPATRTVSIWVGSFPNEEAFDKAIDVEIGQRLDLKVPISSICEVSFETTPVAVRALLEGFSGWKTFVDEATKSANIQPLSNVNAAIVCYYLNVQEPPSRWGSLHFLGSFAGQDAA